MLKRDLQKMIAVEIWEVYARINFEFEEFWRAPSSVSESRGEWCQNMFSPIKFILYKLLIYFFKEVSQNNFFLAENYSFKKMSNLALYFSRGWNSPSTKYDIYQKKLFWEKLFSLWLEKQMRKIIEKLEKNSARLIAMTNILDAFFILGENFFLIKNNHPKKISSNLSMSYFLRGCRFSERKNSRRTWFWK